ncbi:MAG: FAD-dependent oxidoreductase [Clostridia bacterium]|nr:FAD-dependent oxidoreductase [Clostridia bacterium]
MKKETEEIKEKLEYCLNCKIKPCSQKGCPLNNDIPDFIRLAKEEKYEEAYNLLSQTTVLPAICGRICPHMSQCQGSCVRGIKGEPVSIGDIEAFIGDVSIQNGYKIPENQMLKNESKEKRPDEEMNPQKENNQIDGEKAKTDKQSCKNKKVAIIGGGPAGLTCGAFLKKTGKFDVTIYEKYDYLGGLLMHGIPDFRLPREITKKTIEKILDLGINVKYHKELGKNISLEELLNSNDAIFLSFGANVSIKMGVHGEDLKGVYGGNELLEFNAHPDYKGKNVAVIGGGNVAMDCARTIKKMGANSVKVIYRRAEEQMPAEKKEIEDAKKEGIEFLFQNNIVKIIGTKKEEILNKKQNDILNKFDKINKENEIKKLSRDGEVEKIELIKTELIKKDGEDRLVPVNIENSNFQIDIDYVVMALGSKSAEFVKKLGLKLNDKGKIIIDENCKTSNSKIYAGGDIAGNKGTVAWAARSGRNAADAIIRELGE